MRFYTRFLPICLLLLYTFLLQSCIKDTCEKQQQYAYYVPVYKTKAAVKSSIKSTNPTAIINPGKIFIIGKYIFLNEIDKGIHVIDNSNPASPQNISFINIPGNQDISIIGNTLYADVFTDMAVLNIANPTNITVNKMLEGVFPFRAWSGGFAQDTNMVVVEFLRRDTTVTINCNSGNVMFSDQVFFTANPSGSNSANKSTSPIGTAGSMARFALMNNRLYTVSNNDLSIFNVNNPQNPVYVKKLTVSNFTVETIFPFNNKLFIGSSNGMFIYGVNNADNPTLESQFQHVQTCDPVIADDHFAFVTLRSGNRCGGFTNQMDVLDINNISNPKLIKSYPLTNPHGLSKDKNLLFICDGIDGLKIYDAANIYNIIPIKQFTGYEAYDVIATNNIAIVIAKDGLYQYNYATASNIQLLSKLAIQK